MPSISSNETEADVGTPRNGRNSVNGESLFSSEFSDSIPARSNLSNEPDEISINSLSTCEIKYERSAAFAAKSDALIATAVKTIAAKISRLRKLQSERGVRTRLSGDLINYLLAGRRKRYPTPRTV